MVYFYVFFNFIFLVGRNVFMRPVVNGSGLCVRQVSDRLSVF